MRFFLVWLVLFSTSVASIQGDEPRSAPQVGAAPIQWRIVWTEDPAHTATISWSTRVETERNEVLFSSEPRGGSLESYESVTGAHRSGRYSRSYRDSKKTPDGYFHHARLEGLEPDSTVWFVMRSDGVASRELHFRTATEGNEPYSLLAGGDARTGYADRQRMNRLMASLVESEPEILALDHGGDYVFFGDRWDQWNGWLTDHELTTGASGRVLPIIPTRGNHDGGALFEEIFDAPGGAGKNWYETRLGLGLTLLTLNTNVSLAGDQLTWLRARLREGRARSRWMLASYHQPAFPAVKVAGLARIVWVPLFEAFDMDLVLESDGHVIKRTAPIRDESVDPTGVVYVGEGGLGVPQRVPRSKRWYLEPPGLVARGAHLMIVGVGEEALEVRTVGFAVDAKWGRVVDDAQLETFDRFRIERRESYPR